MLTKILKLSMIIFLLVLIIGLIISGKEKPQPTRYDFGKKAVEDTAAAPNLVKEIKNKNGKVLDTKVSPKAYNVYTNKFVAHGDVDENDYLDDHPQDIILELCKPGEGDYNILVFSNSDRLDPKYFSETIISEDKIANQ